jgi:hypothetical protein
MSIGRSESVCEGAQTATNYGLIRVTGRPAFRRESMNGVNASSGLLLPVETVGGLELKRGKANKKKRACVCLFGGPATATYAYLRPGKWQLRPCSGDLVSPAGW